MTKIRGIATEEHYHIFNRGAHKEKLFRDESDWGRFLFLLLYCQTPATLPHIKRYVTVDGVQNGFRVPTKYGKELDENRLVELVAFCIMPNHFHLILREVEEGGIAAYMQRVSVGYTMYFNEKYGASGHLFQGRYKDVHVKDNDQLLYLSAYIHRNPRELEKWKGLEAAYPYSSFQDYVAMNRWGNLIKRDIILEQFAGTPKSNYLGFVNTSSAKLFDEEIEEHLRLI